MQSIMNLKIKNRESFRPFAPAILEDYADKWFELEDTSPYMLFVVPVHERHRVELEESNRQLTGINQLKIVRSTIPAVTHVDYSARIQTVGKEENSKFYDLIHAFYTRTNCPLIVNTSFNVRGEPIVESPSDAYTCFMRTQMDYLIIGNILLSKNSQPLWKETKDWRSIFKPD
jgi:carbamoyltransferase